MSGFGTKPRPPATSATVVAGTRAGTRAPNAARVRAAVRPVGDVPGVAVVPAPVPEVGHGLDVGVGGGAQRGFGRHGPSLGSARGAA